MNSSFKLALLTALVQAQTWTEVTVSPPPKACCTTGWESDEVCNPIQTAIDAAAEYTEIQLETGTYCTENLYLNLEVGNPQSLKNGALAKIDSKNYIKLVAKDSSKAKPLLMIDGGSGIQIVTANNITIQGLELAGNAMDITGEMASNNRQRLTGRAFNGDFFECGFEDESTCATVTDCEWNSGLSACLGQNYNYYSGVCLRVSTSSELIIQDNEIHHCTSAGLHCNQCDNVTITENVVYGNTWWTSSATSGIVFANSQGSGTNTMSYNVVYGNRNYMPFFIKNQQAHGGSNVSNYGAWNMSAIVDGQGVYITRNSDYEGVFDLIGNTAFDNGINGLVVHKSTHEDVTTTVESNRVFENGQTSKAIEGRQTAGGLTVNSGSASTTSTQLMTNNIVTAADDDVTYQCYGTCATTSGSEGNTACGGAANVKFATSIFANATDCSTQDKDNSDVKSSYLPSCQKVCPQYTPFVESEANDCVEPEPHVLCGGTPPDDTTTSSNALQQVISSSVAIVMLFGSVLNLI